MTASIRDLARAGLASALAALAGCNGGSSGSDAFLPGLTNVGLSADGMRGTGELRLLFVDEASEGVDLNGDGDRLDPVAGVYDLADGSQRNLGLATTGFDDVVGDVLIAFVVPEAAQGDTDLNGDGDAEDWVLFVYDERTGLATNTGFALASATSLPGPLPAIGAGLVCFPVSELAQGGTDLDGDGRAESFVVHVYDSRTGLSTNTTRPVTSDIIAREDEFAFTTTELVTGDLNGDGDASDERVFQMFDGVLGGIVSVPLESLSDPLPFGEDWYVLASESGEGADLNGDGDEEDGVWFVLHPHLGTRESLGLSSDLPAGLVCGARLVLQVQEIDGLDRNGDGDALDDLWAVYDPATRASLYLDVQTHSAPAFAGDRLAFTVRELEAVVDLNGDGDLADAVIELADPVLGTVENTGLELDFTFRPEGYGSHFVFPRIESPGGGDWNGDGDELDEVFWTLDARTGEARSTGIASDRQLGASEAELLLVSLESFEGRDLNGDGDLNDEVYVLHDFATSTNKSLRLAAGFASTSLLSDGRGVLLVSEAGQESDLNGDGDRDDAILFVLE